MRTRVRDIHIDLTVLPILSVLEQQCGVPLIGANYRVEASSADAITATALRIARPTSESINGPKFPHQDDKKPAGKGGLSAS
ncbi:MULTISPECIES: hypothetical protein [unclassified Achromobacter]|uniref:hypothetical protein n=1 Tax=unclassified Achromobacter TaxID=2626865 RepID=UPI000B51DEF8|nr:MULTISPECIES: hypothetical protein [unclassified Achromobacter]OWT72949.1 hypothetical protein CEY05_24020 [Achromobacter sp. HZ34]OWT74167.1 hypothetical protein CEY04_22855 [Achromobacter sp. HZ28]